MSNNSNYDKGVKPYGMIYDLLVNEKVPVKWAIDPTKLKDAKDFTADNIDFKGGSFIIPAQYNSIVESIKGSWSGVVLHEALSSFTAPIYTTLSSWPSILVNDEKKKIIEDYFDHASIPKNFDTGMPRDLDDCHDLYIMPHDDPYEKWNETDKNKLLNFINEQKGYFYGACETVGNIEGELSDDFHFLSVNGLQTTQQHTHGDQNYTYNPAYDADPIMQFIGTLDGATAEGSEQIYMPAKGNNWRPLTRVAIYQPIHEDADDGEAGVVVYGHAFEDINKGMILYEAGHKVDNKGTTAEQTAALRVFFNFVLLSAKDKEMNIDINIPISIVSGSSVNLSVTPQDGASPYQYKWTSSCGGSFTDDLASSTDFNAPTVANPTTCQITVVVTDNCDRFSIITQTVTISPAVGPTAVNDTTTTTINTPVDITVLNNDVIGDAALNPGTVSFVALTVPPASEGVFTVNGTGVVTFTPSTVFVGTSTVNYNVCDLNGLCDIATIIVVINPELVGPTAVNDTTTTPLNTPVDITVLSNDVDGDAAINPSTVTFVGTTPPTNEGVFTVSPTTGVVTFTPFTGFVGTSTINYNVCDANALCDVATITVVIETDGPTAVDDNATTPKDTPVEIDILDNDIKGDGDLDPTTVSFVSAQPNTKGTFTVHSTTGLVTFTPVNGFTGSASIDYEVCDENNLCDVATITVYISSGTDTDGDGCDDDVDDYPNDATRCFDIYYPANGNGTLAYEDLWPSKGDYDFNDLVLEYRFKTVTNGTNQIVETFATFTIKAFGAGYENGFGFQLANDNIADADILTVTGQDLQESYVNLAANGIEQGQSIPTIIVYDNAFNIMEHPGQGIGVNTEPWAPYVVPDTLDIFISYKQNTYTYTQLDIANFNPFIMVDLNRGTEVHLPNYAPTDLANDLQFGTWDDDSDENIPRYYKTSTNLPWAINIPEPFAWPIEKQDITWVHLKFAEWAESGGTKFQDWYKDLSGYRNSSLIYDQP